MLKIKLLSKTARLPIYGSEQAIGLDLYADNGSEGRAVFLGAGARRLFGTGIALAIPQGYYGRVAPRSGLAYKHGIDVLAGVIDADYRQEIGVILFNTSCQSFTVTHGDRIAQLILERADRLELAQVEELDETPDAWHTTISL